MILIHENIALTSENILKWPEIVSQKYKETMKKRAVSENRIRLIVEEILINGRAAGGDGIVCQLTLKKEFGNLYLELMAPGREYDPSEMQSERLVNSGFSRDILQRFNVVPKYEHFSRSGGINKLTLKLEKKPLKHLFLCLMILAFLLAVVGYYALANLFGANVVAAIGEVTVSLFNKLTAVIAGIATPLVFFAVLTGILGLGDANTFGKIGKKALGEMMLTYLLSGVIFGTLGGIFYWTGGQQMASGDILNQLTTLILDMIPGNLVEPFLNENDLQVITFSIFCGFVFLLLKKNLPTLEKACFELSSFFNKMISIVCNLLPLIVFLGIFNMLVADSFKEIARIYKMVLLFVLSGLLIAIILTIRSCITTKTPFKVIFKKQFAPLLIVLTTSSQVAALSEHMYCFKKKFGIESDFVDFALPLCVVTYMPCGAAFMGLTVFAAGELAGITVTMATLIKVVIVSIVVAIAAPPIPGSALAVMPIGFAACGIPNDIYPIAVVIGTIVGYFLPAFNCYCLQHKILVTGYKLGKVNLDALRKEEE